MTPRLVVWRHGRTEWNAAGRFQGQRDPRLDAVGRAQALAAAPLLAALAPAVIVSSDLARAADTAAALAARTGLPVGLDARLREIDVGAWGGLTRAEVAARWPEEFAAWTAGTLDRMGGGETYAEAGARAAAVVAEVASAYDGLAVLVTHNGTARALAAHLLGLPLSARRVLAPLGNARWASFGRMGEGWQLVAYNDGVHPEPSRDAAAEIEFPHRAAGR